MMSILLADQKKKPEIPAAQAVCNVVSVASQNLSIKLATYRFDTPQAPPESTEVQPVTPAQ